MMSAMPPRGAGGAARWPERARRTLVLGSTAQQPPAWWLDPVPATLFIVVPIFCFAAYLNQFNYWSFNSTENFVTRRTFLLGLYSAALLILGVLLGRLSMRRRDIVSVIDEDRCTRVLTWYGWITIAAYLLLLGTLMAHIGLVVSLLRGDAAAPGQLREELGRIPGVTSFIQFDVVYLALASAMVTMGGYRISSRLRTMTIAILILTLMRAVLASERLALFEAIAAMFVTPIAYRWRPSVWRGLAPFIGIFFVFLAFAAGEYFRSWQYYKGFYDSYFDFVTQRFSGYFSTSINNGSGTYLVYAQYHPVPQVTVGWITKFPLLKSFFQSDSETLVNSYLENFATLEFNNPGGFYSAFLDYPFAIASAFMLGLGAVIGRIHRSFENKSLVGLMLYPVVFLGMTDLIRVVYITDTRTLPIFLGTGVAFAAIRPLQMPRHRFLTHAAAA